MAERGRPLTVDSNMPCAKRHQVGPACGESITFCPGPLFCPPFFVQIFLLELSHRRITDRCPDAQTQIHLHLPSLPAPATQALAVHVGVEHGAVRGRPRTRLWDSLGPSLSCARAPLARLFSTLHRGSVPPPIVLPKGIRNWRPSQVLLSLDEDWELEVSDDDEKSMTGRGGFRTGWRHVQGCNCADK